MGTLRTRLHEMGAALYRRVGGESSSRSQRPIPRWTRCPLATQHSQSRRRHSQNRRWHRLSRWPSRNWLDRKLQEERNAEVLSTNWTNHEPLGREPRRRTVGIHTSTRQHGCPHQTMDRIPTHQPNKRGIPVGFPYSTAVCRIHGSEKYSENQTLTHQRPRTVRRQRRQRRIGQSTLTSRLFASGLQSPTDFRYADRNQLPVQSLHRHATGDGCQRQSVTGLATLRE